MKKKGREARGSEDTVESRHLYQQRYTYSWREEDLLIWNDILFLTNTFSMKKIIKVSSSSDITIAYKERIEDMRKSVIVSFIRVEKR